MKKNTLTLLLGIFLLPTFAYAEELTLAMGTSTTITASTTEESATSTKANTPPIKSFTVCSQEAIEKRDTHIGSSRSSYNVSMTNALNERKNREKAAVAIVDASDKKDAIKVSVDTYKNQTKAAQNTLTQTRKIVWQEFEDDIKRCREIEDQLVNRAPIEKTTATDEQPSMNTRMMKVEEVAPEPKTIKETIKAQIETFFSLFN